MVNEMNLMQLHTWLVRDDLHEVLTDLFGDHGKTLWYRYYNNGDHNFSKLLHSLDKAAVEKIERSIKEYCHEICA